jgi:hypothetical protein
MYTVRDSAVIDSDEAVAAGGVLGVTVGAVGLLFPLPQAAVMMSTSARHR